MDDHDRFALGAKHIAALFCPPTCPRRLTWGCVAITGGKRAHVTLKDYPNDITDYVMTYVLYNSSLIYS